jgi:hypothetical protein
VVPNANLTITAGPGGCAPGAQSRRRRLFRHHRDRKRRRDDRPGGHALRRVRHGTPNAVWLTGISDASTAYPIDANWMIVGDDENQLLRLFNRTRPGDRSGNGT